MKPIRKSVPTEGVHRWWEAGWMYVMPDFNTHNHSIIEWVGKGKPPSSPDIEEDTADRQGAS